MANHIQIPLTAALIEIIERYGWVQTLLELNSLAQIGINTSKEGEKFVDEIAESIQQIVEGMER
jgi:ribosomal protein S12 methylthiotransferase accessory factor YcaO